ncbi:MAG: proton-conducting transporter membrane subunit, partial [Halonotius sp.]
VIYLVGHALIKATLFLSAGILSSAYGAETIDEYAGLAERAPATTGALAVVALSLVGIPPSVGFLGKWFIGLGAVEAGVWPIAAVVFVSTLLTLSYVAQLIERLYVTPAESTDSKPDEHPSTDDHAVADGGLVERGVAVERVAVVVVLAVAVVALFASAGAFADILDPVFGRFFA